MSPRVKRPSRCAHGRGRAHVSTFRNLSGVDSCCVGSPVGVVPAVEKQEDIPMSRPNKNVTLWGPARVERRPLGARLLRPSRCRRLVQGTSPRRRDRQGRRGRGRPGSTSRRTSTSRSTRAAWSSRRAPRRAGRRPAERRPDPQRGALWVLPVRVQAAGPRQERGYLGGLRGRRADRTGGRRLQGRRATAHRDRDQVTLTTTNPVGLEGSAGSSL
jgi:hypothetical protein